MTPTQYQFISEQLADLKAELGALRADVRASITQQATQAEQIKTIQRAGGGLMAFVTTVLAALVKDRLHL